MQVIKTNDKKKDLLTITTIDGATTKTGLRNSKLIRTYPYNVVTDGSFGTITYFDKDNKISRNYAYICKMEDVVDNENDILADMETSPTFTGSDGKESDYRYYLKNYGDGIYQTNLNFLTYLKDSLFPYTITETGSITETAQKYMAVSVMSQNAKYSKDYGVTWQDIADSGNALDCCISADGNYIIAVLYYVSNNLITSNDGGLNFSIQSLDCWLRFCKISYDGKYQYVGGSYDTPGKIYRSEDYGTTWQECVIPISNAWSDLSISSDGKNLTASSWVGYNGGSKYQTAESYDYGKTWSINYTAPYIKTRGQSTSNSKDKKICIMCGEAIYDSLRPSFISRDYGKTWNVTGLPTNFTFYKTDMSDDGKYIGVCNTDFYLSDDYGVTWSKIFSNLGDVGTGNNFISISETGKYMSLYGTYYINYLWQEKAYHIGDIVYYESSGVGWYICLMDTTEPYVLYSPDNLGYWQNISPDWQSGVSYTVGDIVYYDATFYTCILDTVAPHTELPTNTTYWEVRSVEVYTSYFKKSEDYGATWDNIVISGLSGVIYNMQAYAQIENTKNFSISNIKTITTQKMIPLGYHNYKLDTGLEFGLYSIAIQMDTDIYLLLRLRVDTAPQSTFYIRENIDSMRRGESFVEAKTNTTIDIVFEKLPEFSDMSDIISTADLSLKSKLAFGYNNFYMTYDDQSIKKIKLIVTKETPIAYSAKWDYISSSLNLYHKGILERDEVILNLKAYDNSENLKVYTNKRVIMLDSNMDLLLSGVKSEFYYGRNNVLIGNSESYITMLPDNVDTIEHIAITRLDEHIFDLSVKDLDSRTTKVELYIENVSNIDDYVTEKASVIKLKTNQTEMQFDIINKPVFTTHLLVTSFPITIEFIPASDEGQYMTNFIFRVKEIAEILNT